MADRSESGVFLKQSILNDLEHVANVADKDVYKVLSTLNEFRRICCAEDPPEFVTFDRPPKELEKIQVKPGFYHSKELEKIQVKPKYYPKESLLRCEIRVPKGKIITRIEIRYQKGGPRKISLFGNELTLFSSGDLDTRGCGGCYSLCIPLLESFIAYRLSLEILEEKDVSFTFYGYNFVQDPEKTYYFACESGVDDCVLRRIIMRLLDIPGFTPETKYPTGVLAYKRYRVWRATYG